MYGLSLISENRLLMLCYHPSIVAVLVPYDIGDSWPYCSSLAVHLSIVVAYIENALFVL